MIKGMIEGFCVSIGVILIVMILIIPIIFLANNISNEFGKYQYECVTLDNETITCDRVNTTEGGIIGIRDDTSYLIKQYKKIKKVN